MWNSARAPTYVSNTVRDTTLTGYRLVLPKKKRRKDKRNLRLGKRYPRNQQGRTWNSTRVYNLSLSFLWWLCYSLPLSHRVSLSPWFVPSPFLSVLIARSLSVFVTVFSLYPFVYIRFWPSHFLFILLSSTSLSISLFLSPSHSVLRGKAEETPAVARSFSKVLLVVTR